MNKTEITEKIIACAASAYEVPAENIRLETKIREELSNQSMLMISFISEIEDELGVTIEIRDAADMYTIEDFVNAAKDLLGE